MNLPDGITQEQYEAACTLTGWKPRQLCKRSEQGPRTLSYNHPCDHGYYETHDIPLPPLTDALLMAMLREGQRQWSNFLFDVWARIVDEDVDAAIILAAARVGPR